MKTVKQLSLFLENKPGTLAAVCKALADEKINIQAISVSDAVDHAVVRMVVSDPRRAASLPGAPTGAMILRVDNVKKAQHILRGH